MIEHLSAVKPYIPKFLVTFSLREKLHKNVSRNFDLLEIFCVFFPQKKRRKKISTEIIS